MKKIIYLSIFLIGAIVSGQNENYYNVNSGDGHGLRFWSSDLYKIHMGVTSEYQYGPVSGYSIKMNMSNSPDRGWTWGVEGEIPIAALNTLGDFQINRNFVGKGSITISDNNVNLPTNAIVNDPDNYVNNFDFRIRKSNNSFYVGVSNEFNVRKVYLQSGHVSSNWATGTGSISLNPFGGNVGIGTTTPDSKLTVAGNIHSREVKVTVNAGADFVFEDNYNLPSLEEVQQFIQENGHLPEIASAKEMETNGIHLAEMNIKLLQKIEELTLYVIEQEKKIKQLNEEIAKIKKQETRNHNLEAKNKELEDRLTKLEQIINE